jgi:hypothetical protein
MKKKRICQPIQFPPLLAHAATTVAASTCGGGGQGGGAGRTGAHRYATFHVATTRFTLNAEGTHDKLV